MIRSIYLVTDLVVTNFIHKPLGSYKIIQTPANIFGSGIHHVSPERVFFLLVWVKMPKCVNKSFIEQVCESLTLFWSESSIFLVGFWIGQINFFMGYIEIST